MTSNKWSNNNNTLYILIVIYPGYKHDWALRDSVYIAHSLQLSFRQSGCRIYYFANHCNGFNFNFCILKVKHRNNTKGYELTDLPTDWVTNQSTNQSTPWSCFLPKKQIMIPQESRNSPHFMEPEGSLPRSQQPATCPILSHINPVHAIPSYFFKIHFNIIPPMHMSCFRFPHPKPYLHAMNKSHKFWQVMWHHCTQYLTYLHAATPW